MERVERVEEQQLLPSPLDVLKGCDFVEMRNGPLLGGHFDERLRYIGISAVSAEQKLEVRSL